MPPLSEYLRNLNKHLAEGNATEHTFRPALKSLIEALSPGVLAVNEPKREACGAPDFVIVNGATPLCYIETKDLDKSLSEIEGSEQRRRHDDLTHYRRTIAALAATIGLMTQIDQAIDAHGGWSGAFQTGANNG